MERYILRATEKLPPNPPSPAELRASMPKVGDRMTRVPYYMRDGYESPKTPVWCTVVYVNIEHLWYLVKYHGSGFTEAIRAVEGNYRKSDPL